MSERAEVKLRHNAWEQIRRLTLRKEEIGIALGEGGMNLVDELMEVVVGVHSILGVVEFELDLPGAFFNSQLQENITTALTKLSNFLGDGSKRQHNKEVATIILHQLSPLSNWMESGEPLVIAENMSARYNDDKDKIVKILVDCDESQRLFVVPIIGESGTGKTTITQHVYHDERIYRHFQVRHWVCMSETHETRSKLLHKVFRMETSDSDVLKEFHDLVDDRKYLLILDGLAHPVRNWDDLFCKVGKGSKIVITASSTSIVDHLGTLTLAKGAPYELGCLSQDEAMRLFTSITFRDGDEMRNRNLYDIGLKLCKKNSRIPLIKNIATFLSTKDDIQEIEYGALESTLSKINISNYKDLASNKQQCVNYCSLFPVEYEFQKEYLIHLWSSQDLIAKNVGPTQVLGDEYFQEFLENGYFFELTKRDTNANCPVVSYKMHKFAYQFIKDVSKNKFLLVDSRGENIEYDTIMHLSFTIDSSWISPSWIHGTKQLLSLLFLPRRSCDFTLIPDVGKILASLEQLRALDLLGVNCENLPESIGELQDLKYLRLGCSSEYLPQFISNLQNLETLDLRHSKVRELPKDFSKLINLKNLYTGDRLDDLPPNFKILKYLRNLDVFIVGENNGLDTLSHLSQLSGELKIRYKKNNLDERFSGNPSSLLNSIHLNDLSLIWSTSYEESATDGSEFLLPPPTLQTLKISHWKGISFPRGLSNLDNLKYLHIKDCNKCSDLPVFSKIPHLKYIELMHLDALEYIEKGDDAEFQAPYFPSLEHLTLSNLPNLKEWSPAYNQYVQQPSFPRLTVLRISGCPKVISMPLASILKSLEAENVNEKFLTHILTGSSTLEKLRISAISDLVSFSMNLSSVTSFEIRRCPLLKTLIVEPSSSLRKFEVRESGKLINIIGALKHLSVDWKSGVVRSWNEQF